MKRLKLKITLAHLKLAIVRWGCVGLALKVALILLSGDTGGWA